MTYAATHENLTKIFGGSSGFESKQESLCGLYAMHLQAGMQNALQLLAMLSCTGELYAAADVTPRI